MTKQHGSAGDNRRARKPGEMMALGLTLGTAVGVSLGLALDNLAMGIAIGVGTGTAIGAALERPSGHREDDDAEDRSVARALMWLFVGLAVLVALIVLSAPELVWTDPAATSELLLFATLAGVPGLALLLWLAYRRRGEDADTSPSQHPEGHPDQREGG